MNIEELQQRIEFLEALVKKYVVNGEEQFSSLQHDYEKEQGLFRK